MIAAAPPLASSSPDSNVASSGSNIAVLTEEEEQQDGEDKEEEKDKREEEEEAKVEEEKQEEENDKAMAEVQTIAEIQLQELKEARDRVFQSFIQKEARRVAAMIAAAPPLATSSLDSDVASSGTNLPVLTREEDQEDSEELIRKTSLHTEG